MSILNELASAQDIKSDVPNQKLAKKLAESNDAEAINELVANLSNKEKAIQSDCIKTLYEIGYIKPELIAQYADDFIKLLNSKNNRLVWGSMIALSTIAGLATEAIYKEQDVIKTAVKKGSVITVDAGIKTLAIAAAANDDYNAALFPYLMDVLRTCRPKSVAQYAESMATAVTPTNITEFRETVEARKSTLTASQLKRVEKLLRKIPA